MPTDSFRNLEKVCIALGLERKETKYGFIYTGKGKNGEFARLSIHAHAMGRDIATGTFSQYVKDLGFNNQEDYFKFLKTL